MEGEAALPVLVSCDVDWITLTETRKGSRSRLQNLAVPLIEKEQQRGNQIRAWGMAGYEGLCAGQCQVGTGSQGAIVRLSSVLAAQKWRELCAHADGCSRLDLQLTVRHPTKVDHLIARHFRQASSYRREHGSVSTVSLFRSSDGSATLYLGKRISERFGRAYDKEKESTQPEWARCIRYELELKGDRASSALDHLRRTHTESSDSETSGTPAALASNGALQSSWISSTVSGFFRGRGVVLPIVTNPLSTTSDPAPKADLQRKLEWARKSLRPTVALFASHGKLSELLAALGLQCSQGQIEIAPPD